MDNAIKIIIGGACVAILLSIGMLQAALSDKGAQNIGNTNRVAPIQKIMGTTPRKIAAKKWNPPKMAVDMARKQFDFAAKNVGCEITVFRPLFRNDLFNITARSENPAALTDFIKQCRARQLINSSDVSVAMSSVVQDNKRFYEITYTVKLSK